jgi:glycosyltransferase involved in cell wall biosynthesis
MVLVVPSIWYEGLPMTIVEGLATGLPLVVPRLGALPTLAPAASKTFEAGDSESLAATLREVASDPTGVGALRVTAREIFDAVYSPERNYAMLRDIYEQAIGR